MAIRGSLKEASLPDVLQLLAMGRKTGCLSVSHRSNFGYIFFDEGRISFASIVNRRDRLGEILVKSRLVTQEALDAALAQQAHAPGARLGDVLVSGGLISRDELNRQIRVQIEEAVYFLFTWTQGAFSFEADVRPEDQDYLVAINPDALLLEGARRVDEWTLIEKKIASFDLVFDIDRRRLADAGVQLTAEQETLVPLVNGVRDVAALVEESGLVEFEVGKALFGLLTAGFLRQVGKTKAAEPQVPEARVEEHRNLGIAFYKTGMLDEAAREFRRVSELRPGDAAAQFYTGLLHLRRERWEDAAAAFREAAAAPLAKPAVFHNLAYALERLGHDREAGAALAEAVRRGGGADPRVQTSLGAIALRQRDPAAADAALAAARPLFGRRPPSAAWYHYAALAAAASGDAERAEQLLEEGVRHHSHAAPLYNNLAVVQERRGKYGAAADAAERGTQEDPSLAQLHKNAGDYHYRAGRYDDALDRYQRAIKSSPALGADVYLKMGNIRYRRQEAHEAVAAWEQASALAPDNRIIRSNLDAVRRLL